MNKDRRKIISNAIDMMANASALLEEARTDEEDAMSALEGTNLESTDKYSVMEEAVDVLQDAQDSLEEIIYELQNII